MTSPVNRTPNRKRSSVSDWRHPALCPRSHRSSGRAHPTVVLFNRLGSRGSDSDPYTPLTSTPHLHTSTPPHPVQPVECRGSVPATVWLVASAQSVLICCLSGTRGPAMTEGTVLSASRARREAAVRAHWEAENRHDVEGVVGFANQSGRGDLNGVEQMFVQTAGLRERDRSRFNRCTATRSTLVHARLGRGDLRPPQDRSSSTWSRTGQATLTALG